jgi:probable rRNA maturation factor
VQNRQQQELATRAAQIDEGLELAVVYEPPPLVNEDTFGLDDSALRRIVALTLARVGVVEPAALNVLVTDDEGLRSLNLQYRGQDEVTDVLSFPWLDAPLVNGAPDELWPATTSQETRIVPLDGHDSRQDPLAASTPLGDAEEMEVGTDLPGENRYETEFPMLEESTALNLGDIALSRDAVERQAARANHSAAWEFAYLLAHGVLHLVGYDDLTDAGYHAMVVHQEAVLADAGITRRRNANN